ncbi:hypothetical protein ATM99_17965 [Cellulomonas sp. B6]|nr:hypothetical protein ATM99_17965 [Cellulomonas sp. B6]
MIALVVVLSVLGALAVPVVLAVAIPVVLNQTRTEDCSPEVAPAGAGPDAVAYVDAVNRSTPGRVALSDKIEAAGMQMYAEDLQTAVALDDAFLADLRTIEFSPAARPAADRFVVAVEQYRAFVQRALDRPGYLDAHRAEDDAVNDERASAGRALREALGLDRTSCRLNRP